MFAVGERFYNFRDLVCYLGLGNDPCRLRESRQDFVHIAEQRIGVLFIIRGPEIQKQQAHRFAFIHKDADIALGLSQRQGVFQRGKGLGAITLCRVGQRLYLQDVEPRYPGAFALRRHATGVRAGR